MALISFTKVAREDGAISFWLVYSSNITVCEALALSEGELERKTWGLVLYSQYTKTYVGQCQKQNGRYLSNFLYVCLSNICSEVLKQVTPIKAWPLREL